METKKTAPYSPVEHIITIINRTRTTRLRPVITSDFLIQLGIPESVITSSIRALKFLTLVDEENKSTANFEQLVRASNEDYPEVLSNILKEVYKDIFDVTDVSKNNTAEIEAAFRAYDPLSKLSRMIIFFKALCSEARIITDTTVSIPKKPATSKPNKPSQKKQASKKDNLPAPEDNEQEKVSLSTTNFAPSMISTTNPEYILLHAMLEKLPRDQRWTSEKRDKWLKAFNANLDWLIEVEDGRMIEAYQETPS